MDYVHKELALLKYISAHHNPAKGVGVTSLAPMGYVSFGALCHFGEQLQFTEQDIFDISWAYPYLQIKIVTPLSVRSIKVLGISDNVILQNSIVFATDFNQGQLEADIASIQENLDTKAGNIETSPQINEIILVRAKESAIGRLVINKDYAGALHIEYAKKHWALLLKLAKQGHLFTGSKEDATLISYLNTDTSCALYSNKTGFSPQPIIQREGNKYVLVVPLKMMTLTQFNKKINKEK